MKRIDDGSHAAMGKQRRDLRGVDGVRDEVDVGRTLLPGMRPTRNPWIKIRHQEPWRVQAQALGFPNQDEGWSPGSRTQVEHLMLPGRRKKRVEDRRERTKETAPAERAAQCLDDRVAQAGGNPALIVELE
jgi:hypothetical protein